MTRDPVHRGEIPEERSSQGGTPQELMVLREEEDDEEDEEGVRVRVLDNPRPAF